MRVEIGHAMAPFFGKVADDGGPVRYRVARGGRGGIKSWSIARALLAMGLTESLFIVCAREFQKSIRDSVHRLLEIQVDLLKWRSEYIVRDTYIKNRHTGAEFVFHGLHHNVTSIKSLESADICWVAEAESISDDSWDTLDPTMRKKGSEIWVDFNPKDENDPTYQRFVVKPRPGTLSVVTGWKDNPWLSDEMRRQAEWMREHDPELYEHIWGGKTWFKNDAQVLKDKWHVKEFEPESSWYGPYFGADWGFSQDPTAVTKSYVEVLNPEDLGKGTKAHPAPLRRNLYIREEAFEVGCEIVSTPERRGLRDLFDTVTEIRNYPIRADNARPETISHMKLEEKFDVRACDKWQGCAEDRVTYFRGFENIYIHPSCPHMIEEARLWSYKVDPFTKVVLRALKPGYDHGWDATGYAHEAMIQHRPKPATSFQIKM